MKISNTFNHTQYTTFADQYLQSNQDGSIGGMTPDSRVKELERYLPKGRKIFEIGSGGGLDAIALKNAGYEVV
ncbi:MAG: hypothetical protein LBO09_09510 [Candidatus Peribacteria bacterium]|jgi:hypothetical protein|nr:hypothetical protein [Candidatus Peribacteria bacterium]